MVRKIKTLIPEAAQCSFKERKKKGSCPLSSHARLIIVNCEIGRVVFCCSGTRGSVPLWTPRQRPWMFLSHQREESLYFMAIFWNMGGFIAHFKSTTSHHFPASLSSCPGLFVQNGPFSLGSGWTQVPINCYLYLEEFPSMVGKSRVFAKIWCDELSSVVTSVSRMRSQLSEKADGCFTTGSLSLDFLFYLCWVFLFMTTCINHTGKGNPVRLSGRVIGKIGNYFSFEKGRDQQLLVFYRMVELAISIWHEGMEAWRVWNTCPRSYSWIKAGNGFEVRVMTHK